jgi:hypothetical protein
MEDAGIVFDKAGTPTNAINLSTHQDLGEGYSFSVEPIKKSGKMAFLFHKGKMIVRVWTGKKGLEMSGKAKDLMPYRLQILKMLGKADMASEDPGMLEDLHLYTLSYRIQPEEMKSKETYFGLEWSRNETKDGRVFTCWVKNKPIMRIEMGTTKAMFGRGRYSMLNSDVVDANQCVRNSAALVQFLNDKVDHAQGAYALETAGIIHKKSGEFVSIVSEKLAEADGLMVARSADKSLIGIFDKQGLLAKAVIRATGAIDKIDIPWRSKERVDPALQTKIDQTFEKMQSMLMGQKVKEKEDAKAAAKAAKKR